MSRRPLTLAHAALVAWAAVSIAAFALAFAAWPLLVVLPAAIASAVRRLDRIPPRAQRGLRWTGWIFAGVGAFLPLLVTFQGMTP
ncbi:MAG: hypothetical protein HY293_22905, partial [Planctomycetes bacterium]|nr:hypothetical protein [Planctomycetota bacterium]